MEGGRGGGGGCSKETQSAQKIKLPDCVYSFVCQVAHPTLCFS